MSYCLCSNPIHPQSGASCDRCTKLIPSIFSKSESGLKLSENEKEHDELFCSYYENADKSERYIILSVFIYEREKRTRGSILHRTGSFMFASERVYLNEEMELVGIEDSDIYLLSLSKLDATALLKQNTELLLKKDEEDREYLTFPDKIVKPVNRHPTRKFLGEWF